jgi:imidazolonepropionase-like amidohydrolase
MALIPTLTLFDFEARNGQMSDADRESLLNNMTNQLSTFASAGGEVLFGTDIGYTDHFDTELEFQLMSRANMDYRAILASLTTNPARRFRFADRKGRIESGMDADLTILNGDPGKDLAAFSRISATIKAGVVIFSKR